MHSVGPYVLDALVGRGATGEVWRATRQGSMPLVVAVKRTSVDTDAEGLGRLRREAAVLAELDHPHIVGIIDIVEDADSVALVMPLARGGSLADLLAAHGTLTVGQTVAVLGPVADALGSAHRHGVLHGDVKPSNILFTADGEPLLGDFGTARHLVASPGQTSGGPGARVEGTTGYVDPSLLATRQHDPINDVYGLAVVAHQCLTGRLPASDVSLLEVPCLPHSLAALVTSALAPDPRDRPATADLLAEGLRQAVPTTRADLPGVADGRPSDLEPGESRADPLLPSLEPGTRQFGPRPPRVEEPHPRRRAVKLATALTILVGVCAAAGVWVQARVRSAQSTGPVVAAARPRAHTPAACPPLPSVAAEVDEQEFAADLVGNGCPVRVVWSPARHEMSFRLDQSDNPQRFVFTPAESGMEPLFGDWDCDGDDTPAAYQPRTGIVVTIPDLPTAVDDEVTGRRHDSGIIDGRARVVEGRGQRCDTVSVSPRR